MDRTLGQIRHDVKLDTPLGQDVSRDERHASNIDVLASTPGFQRLRDELVSRARPSQEDRVLDIGAGTGLLAIAVAPSVAHVVAVDNSPAVSRLLERKARDLGITNLTVAVADARQLPLESSSIDLAMSNYCLHHLDNEGKLIALAEIARVLRPGGRLVLGDMMFTVGVRTARDRRVIAHLAMSMVRRHPAGFVRLLTNVVRALFAPSERPASVEWWERALTDSGFAEVSVTALEHEGGIACARRPA